MGMYDLSCGSCHQSQEEEEHLCVGKEGLVIGEAAARGGESRAGHTPVVASNI